MRILIKDGLILRLVNGEKKLEKKDILIKDNKTEKIIEQGKIGGYSLTEIGGKSEIFAHIDFPKRVSFQNYGVD